MSSTGDRGRFSLELSAAQWLAVIIIVGLPHIAVQYALNEGNRSAQRVRYSIDVRTYAREMAVSLRDAESAAYAIVLGAQIPDIHLGFERARVSYEQSYAQMRSTVVLDPEKSARLELIAPLARASLAYLSQAVEFSGRGQSARALQALTESATRQYPVTEITNFLQDEALQLKRIQDRDDEARIIVRWVSVAAAFLQLGLLGWFLYARTRQNADFQLETQARHRAEERQRADERAGQMLRSMRDPMAVLDGDLRIVNFNPAFAVAYGSNPAVLTPLQDIGEGSWADLGLLQRLRDVHQYDRELRDMEIEQKQGNSPARIVLISAQSLPQAGDGARTIMLSVADITARRRDEQEVRRLNLRLRLQIEEALEANRELESFSRSVAHDLRAPLRHVAGFAERLAPLVSTNLDDKAHQYINIILRSIARMAEMIDALLAYAQMGRTAINRATVDMNLLCMEAQAVAKSGASGATISWNIGRLPPASGDATLLRAVWQNLLSNAVKFSAKRETPKIDIGALLEHDASPCVYFVRDNGIGFDMAYTNKLFGLFQRLHSDNQFPGTGIGLANVRRIVERHGGRVWAESAADQGATFFFTLEPESTDNTSHRSTLQ